MPNVESEATFFLETSNTLKEDGRTTTTTTTKKVQKRNYATFERPDLRRLKYDALMQNMIITTRMPALLSQHQWQPKESSLFTQGETLVQLQLPMVMTPAGTRGECVETPSIIGSHQDQYQRF